VNSARRAAVVAASLSLLAACQRSAGLPAPAPPDRGAAPSAASRPTPRRQALSRLGWSAGWLRACGVRRVERPGQPDDERPGPCVTGGARLDQPPPPSLSEGATGLAPGVLPPRCWLSYEDAPGDPAAAAVARATLVGPTGRVVLDQFSPPAETDGDYFAIDASISPDGRLLGIARLSVGLGVGEQLVRVISVEVRPAPTCR
jgi:hypothetical protein